VHVFEGIDAFIVRFYSDDDDVYTQNCIQAKNIIFLEKLTEKEIATKINLKRITECK
jgi:hypothetical protein